MTPDALCHATTTLTGQTLACLKPPGHHGHHRDREGFQWGEVQQQLPQRTPGEFTHWFLPARPGEQR